MKTVFSNMRQCAHVWASRSQSDGRAGNLFFEDGRIYSYGRHFCIARFVTNSAGDVACLVNPASYSISTSRHQSLVRRAIPSYIPTFSAPDAEVNHSATLKWYEGQIDEAFGKASRARINQDWHADRGRAMIDEFNRYAEFFGIPDRIAMPDSIAAALAQAKQRTAQQAERERIARAEHEARVAVERKKQQRKDRETMRKWLAGADVHLPYSIRDADVRLRVKGETIQTSHGAEVPLSVASSLWHLICDARDNPHLCPISYAGLNIRVWHFELREIKANGDVQIGCHFIRYAELERIARALGLIESEQVAA